MYNSQDTYNRIRDMVKRTGISIKKLNEECSLSENAISSASKSQDGMKARNLYAISNCLDCSVDFLLGRTDNPQAHKSAGGGLVNNAPIKGDYNMNAGNINVNTSSSASYQDELNSLYSKLTLIQQAKLLSLVSDVVDGKAEL